jgi:hypothetical protein
VLAGSACVRLCVCVRTSVCVCLALIGCTCLCASAGDKELRLKKENGVCCPNTPPPPSSSRKTRHSSIIQDFPKKQLFTIYSMSSVLCHLFHATSPREAPKCLYHLQHVGVYVINTATTTTTTTSTTTTTTTTTTPPAAGAGSGLQA